jgi:hypothetical protein
VKNIERFGDDVFVMMFVLLLKFFRDQESSKQSTYKANFWGFTPTTKHHFSLWNFSKTPWGVNFSIQFQHFHICTTLQTYQEVGTWELFPKLLASTIKFHLKIACQMPNVLYVLCASRSTHWFKIHQGFRIFTSHWRIKSDFYENERKTQTTICEKM